MSDLADLAQRTRARRPIAGIRHYSNADVQPPKHSSTVDDLLAAIKAQEAQTYARLKGLPDERVSLTPARETLGRAGRLALETGLAPGTARSEDFTPPIRTVTQELGKRAGELGGMGMLTAPIPVVGEYTTPVSSALLALGALQQLVHPFREEGENRLWGTAELAGSALPYAGKLMRTLRPAATVVEGGGYGVYPRGMGPNPTPDMPRGGEAIKSYLQGRTPEETVRRVYGQKPGTFMSPARYGEQRALEGLRQAGATARGTRAARAAELQAARTSLPPEFAAVGEEPFFRSARRATQAGERATVADVAEAAEERNRTRRSIEAAKARAAGEMPDIGHAKMAAQVNEAINASRAASVARTPRLDSYTRTLNALKQEAEETTPGADNPFRSDLGEQQAIPEDPRSLLQRYALARLLGLKTVLGTPER